MHSIKVAVALDKVYEARDERGLAVFVRAVKIGNGRVRCQDVNDPGRSLVLPPNRIVREVTDGEIEEANAARLAQLEKDIETKTLIFVDVGNDLKEIRDQRLYRVREHPNFDDYCQVKWGMSRRYADFLIQAAEVFTNLENNCSRLPLPTNESQCRELAKLDDPRLQVRAWEQAVKRLGGRIPTAEQVKAVIETDFRRLSPDPPTAPREDPASSPDAKRNRFRITEMDLSSMPSGTRRAGRRTTRSRCSGTLWSAAIARSNLTSYQHNRLILCSHHLHIIMLTPSAGSSRATSRTSISCVSLWRRSAGCWSKVVSSS